MSPTDLLFLGVLLLLIVSVSYLAWWKPAPGRVTFIVFMVFGICLSIVFCRGRGQNRGPILPYWVGGLLALIFTPPFYLIWARMQSAEETWADHHDHSGRMPTRSKTFTIADSRDDEL